MRQTVIRTVHLRDAGRLSAAVVAAAAFSAGAVLGCLMAGSASQGAMSTTLADYLDAVRTGTLRTEWTVLIWRCLRLPLAAFLCGFSVLGLVGVPAVLGMEGFTLCYTISAFLRVYGRSGYYPAAAVLGLAGLAAVPAVVLPALESWQGAGSLLRSHRTGRRETGRRERWKSGAMACGCTAVYLLVERFALVPALVLAERFL